MQENIILKEINIYPVKSCRGTSVTEWPISSNGLLYDREWTIVDEKGKAMSLQKYPILGKIIPFINLKKNTLQFSFEDNINDMEIKLDYIPNILYDKKVRIYGDTTDAYVYSDNINNWFRNILSIRCSLVRQIQNSRFTKNNENVYTDTCIGFSNEGQYLLISENSVNDVNKRLYDKYQDNSKLINSNRFRANLIISGLSAYEEDDISSVKISNLQFTTNKICARCNVICVDQEKGTKLNSEPFLTLSTYRRNNGKTIFGILLNYILDDDTNPVISIDSNVIID